VAVPGRRGRTQVAAHRAAVADLRRADRPRGHREPGQALPQLVDDAGVGDAGAQPHPPVVQGVPFLQVRHTGEVEQGGRTPVVEVDLDHDVGAACHRHGVRLLRLRREGVGPRRRREEIHAEK
jgi:hypothetical protein